MFPISIYLSPYRHTTPEKFAYPSRIFRKKTQHPILAVHSSSVPTRSFRPTFTYNRFTRPSRLSLALRPATMSALKSLCWSCLCVKKSMCPSQWRWSARKRHLNSRPLARICVGNAYRNLFNVRYNFTSQSRLSLALRPVTTSALKSLCWSCLCVKKSMCPSQWRWSARNKALDTTAACSDLCWQCI